MTDQATLVLFDIDGTLISSGGAGIRAMLDAGRRLFGGSFTIEDVEFAGRLDPLIVHDVFVRNGLPLVEDEMSKFVDGYHDALPDRLARHEAAALPGVVALTEAVQRLEHMIGGLLTGNYEPMGSTKLRTCGLDPQGFEIRVWGDASRSDPPTREDLPVVAMQRCREVFGIDVPPERVIVIGDTPHDVRCASVNGCRSIAVATGQYGVEDLTRAGADLAVDDLSDTSRVMDWIQRPATSSSRRA